MKENDDIHELFESLKDKFADSGEFSHRVFHMLVRLSLKYRDELASKGQPSLTVGETRDALGKFMDVIKTKSWPDKMNEREKELITRWLNGLNELKNN